MTGASNTVCEFSSVVRGQYVYKMYGLHSLTKPNKCIIREDNKHDKYAANDQL